MTIQNEEIIIINGDQYTLLSRPLDSYLKILDDNLRLAPYGSHCWRGYMGEWTIRNNVLFLTNLKIRFMPEDEKKLMPLIQEKVNFQADWYTGQLRVPFGKEYDRTSYNYPLTELEMIFEVDRGVILDHKIIKNDPPVYEDNDGLPF